MCSASMVGYRRMITPTSWFEPPQAGATAPRHTVHVHDAPRTPRLQDAVAANGLYLMATFYMGDATEAPVQTQSQRDKVIDNFVHQVGQYASHPGLLIWSFGNELNGVWNGFLQQVCAVNSLSRACFIACRAFSVRRRELCGRSLSPVPKAVVARSW